MTHTFVTFALFLRLQIINYKTKQFYLDGKSIEGHSPLNIHACITFFSLQFNLILTIYQNWHIRWTDQNASAIQMTFYKANFYIVLNAENRQHQPIPSTNLLFSAGNYDVSIYGTLVIYLSHSTYNPLSFVTKKQKRSTISNVCWCIITAIRYSMQMRWRFHVRNVRKSTHIPGTLLNPLGR